MLDNTRKAILLVGIGALTALASCTVSEPKAPAGDPESLQFTGISSFGMTLMSVEYDNYNRVTMINFGNEMIYEMAYASDSDVIPVSVVSSEYEEGWDYDRDKYVLQLSERDTWSNIHGDSYGKITGFDCVSEHYDGDATTYVEKWRQSYRYDLAGHIIQQRVVDTKGSVDEVTYEWENGLLMRYYDNDTDHHEVGVYEYSDVENVNLQWDPNNQALGPMAITGFFGKAPSRFLKSERITIGDYDNEYYQYAYTLHQNGLINMSKVVNEDDGTLVFNFLYKKVK